MFWVSVLIGQRMLLKNNSVTTSNYLDNKFLKYQKKFAMIMHNPNAMCIIQYDMHIIFYINIFTALWKMLEISAQLVIMI